jgi:hypothetical protein
MKKLLVILLAAFALGCEQRSNDDDTRYDSDRNQSETRADESSENDDDEMISTDTTSTKAEGDTTSMRDDQK